MFDYILVCLVVCIILVGLVTNIVPLCSIKCVHAYVWLIMHCLCMLRVACGNVYSRVMVVVTHEVISCIIDMVLHR